MEKELEILKCLPFFVFCFFNFELGQATDGFAFEMIVAREEQQSEWHCEESGECCVAKDEIKSVRRG